MIAKLTKDQIAKLSPEQQEVVARLVIDEGRRERLILSVARGYRGYKVFPGLVLVGVFGFWRAMEDAGVLVPILAFAAFSLIQFHAMGINSRLDAVLNLVDLKKAKEPEEMAVQADASDGDKPAN